MRIRNNTRRKKARKRQIVKEEQKGKLVYVEFSDKVLKRKPNGKWSRNSFDIVKGRGVQYENKVYLKNGRYKLVNRRTFRVTKEMPIEEVGEKWVHDLADRFRQDNKVKQ